MNSKADVEDDRYGVDPLTEDDLAEEQTQTDQLEAVEFDPDERGVDTENEDEGADEDVQ